MCRNASVARGGKCFHRRARACAMPFYGHICRDIWRAASAAADAALQVPLVTEALQCVVTGLQNSDFVRKSLHDFQMRGLQTERRRQGTVVFNGG